MITKMEYATKIAEKVNGQVQVVTKNNDVERIGIIRKLEDSNISPCVYIDPFYEDDMLVDDAAREVNILINKNQMPNIDVQFMTEFNSVKDKLRAKLVNKITTVEVYRSAENVGFDDLIIVPYIEVGTFGDGTGTVTVNGSLLDKWGVEANEVIDIALANSAKEVEIASMSEMLGLLEMPGTPKMIVVTNKMKCNGAISVLFASEQLKREFPDGYIVIPSSIHEVIATALSEDDVNGMIGEVNETEVNPEEQLGNHAYIFK